MASVARSLTRLPVRATPLTLNFRSCASRHARFALPSQPFQSSSRRSYASGPSTGSSTLPFIAVAVALAGASGYYLYQANGSPRTLKESSSGGNRGVFTPTYEDYQKVYNDIAALLEEKDDYDDGSYGPVLLRLAWHCSGTYDKATGTGGSNGATMRFAPEGDHGANAGLKAARDFLEPVKRVCAIQEMQGPQIPWRPGRADRDVSMCTPDGRLPDGAKDQSHLRAIFGRMGFDDREIVALSGAHALGRCHTDRSGFEGPWTFSPTVVSNDYFRLLMDEKWKFRQWDGPKQYQDATSKSLMMLPTDMALIKDKAFKKHVERYAKDDQVFFSEFRDVLVKLFELGVPFQSKEDERMLLKPTT
ncbi:MAG: hypothetical protein Q9167_002614 [Letrouitia subvulpina]